jgi:hypothetical protein
MKAKVKAILIGLALAAGMVIGIQAPAAAAFTDCPNGQACVWVDAFGGGARMNIPFSTYVGFCWNLPATWRNAVSSARTTYGGNNGLRLFTSQGCGGATWDLKPGTQTSWLNGGFYNDNFESFQIWNYPA